MESYLLQVLRVFGSSNRIHHYVGINVLLCEQHRTYSIHRTYTVHTVHTVHTQPKCREKENMIEPNGRLYCHHCHIFLDADKKEFIDMTLQYSQMVSTTYHILFYALFTHSMYTMFGRQSDE